MTEMEGMSQSCLTGRETGWLQGDGGFFFVCYLVVSVAIVGLL